MIDKKSVEVGFSMHPRWAEMGGLVNFLEPLRAVGLDTLEFELDHHLPDWKAFQPLIHECDLLGMQLCFHAPYRKPYHLQGFSSYRRQEVIVDTSSQLQIADEWANKKGKAVNVVIHGGVGVEGEQQSLLEDTVHLLAWSLKTYPGLRFALENNHPSLPGQVKVGETRSSVLSIVQKINHPHLGICWDMGHDYLGEDIQQVSSDWLSKVIHAHVHDVDETGTDHYPLVFGRVPYNKWLPLFNTAPSAGKVITLELKGGQLTGWSREKVQQALIDSITKINKSVQ